MSSSSSSQRPRRSPRSSINYSWIPLDLKSLDPPATSTSSTNPMAPSKEEAATGTILTTSDLVSVLGGVWRALGHHSDESSPASPLPTPKPSTCSRNPPGSHYYDEVTAMRRSLLFDLRKGFLSKTSGDILRGVRLRTPRVSSTESDSSPKAISADRDVDLSVSDDVAVREESQAGSVTSSCVENADTKIERVGGLVGGEFDSREVSSIKGRIGAAFAKKRCAVAGAMAGAFVCLCLHPVDTVKTVVQVQSGREVDLYSTYRSIVAQRGITGLYRGIASSIASSAPISAVYTFTYETVKGALLPLLPKEYHSLAHCTAGGCASIATSFIFTPSERIKQQMQVRSNYQNCWNALVRILGKGGLQALYAGWGAVLCRNVPHSIIKFYTYESLKQFLLLPSQSDASLSTLQTLLCGGIAGSTAALFSTPFDVVKTKLQTQLPGSPASYNGVFRTMKQITRNEGLSGIYRGLSPRLIMYMCQGAIFFASYEFFKAILSLEILSGLPSNCDIRQKEGHLKI